MKGQPAKVLAPNDVARLLRLVAKNRYPDRDKVIVLLSVKAGLRACEITRLRWPMLLDASGEVGDILELPARAAKMGSGRRIPLQPKLRAELQRLYRLSPSAEGHVILTERKRPFSTKALVNWFTHQFASLGLTGCSSHSGRRTFVTRAARLIYRAGGSLRDVQLLVGHQSIKTTQTYIDGSSHAQRRLVRAI